MKQKGYPKIMLVSNYKDSLSFRQRVVIGEKKKHFIAWACAENFEEAENVLDIEIWKYAQDLPLKVTKKRIEEHLRYPIEIVKE